MTGARYAIYFTPPPGSCLARFGAGVLGYDCDSGEEVARLQLAEIAATELAAGTAEPRRYGFHATLVAPFHPAVGRSEAELGAALAAFAASRRPVALGELRPGLIGGFVVLKSANLDCVAFAADCVRGFHPFRAPLTPADRERRIAAGLSPRQTEYLERWGYPYVFDEFRFHMTLAGPLPASERQRWLGALTDLWLREAAEPMLIDAVSLVRQDDRTARFRVTGRQPLRG